MKWTKRRFFAVGLTLALTLSLAVSAASAASQADELFDRIRTVFEVVQAWHKDGADLETFVEGAIEGGLQALGDPHTNYFSPEDYQAFLDSLNGTFSGIGAYLDLDGNYIVIRSPIKETPAHKAGLRPGDRILEADGVPLVGEPVEKAVQVIRGPEGTTVKLKIERPSEGRTFTVEITRAVIDIPEVESRMVAGHIGYIALTSFGDDVVTDFYKAVERVKLLGARGIILDLRQNGGGYLQAAVDVASAWVPKGEPVVWEVGKGGSKKARRSTGREIGMPVVVLVDGGTASASEIVAGALQDYGIAELVGVKTYGKGTVQQLLTLTDGSGMKVTVAEYLTPKERKVDGRGLTPDYYVEQPEPDPERTRPLAFERVIGAGMVGLDVLYIQQRLIDLGYNPEETGHFGLKSRQAAAQFAADNGLEFDGVIGRRFIEVLNERVAERAKAIAEEDAQLQQAIELMQAKLGL